MEARNIKDFIHLYLGCEIEVDKTTEYKWKLTAVQSDCNLIYARNNQDSRKAQVFIIDKVKPILRPLSDMTEDEKVRVFLWEFPNNDSGELIKNDSDTDSFVCKNEHGMKCYVSFNRFSAETTRKLLKAGFDLFGLIESGLAIDKTTIK